MGRFGLNDVTNSDVTGEDAIDQSNMDGGNMDGPRNGFLPIGPGLPLTPGGPGGINDGYNGRGGINGPGRLQFGPGQFGPGQFGPGGRGGIAKKSTLAKKAKKAK